MNFEEKYDLIMRNVKSFSCANENKSNSNELLDILKVRDAKIYLGSGSNGKAAHRLFHSIDEDCRFFDSWM